MARILAYTSPALGHMLPMSALLCELKRRGHDIHLRTLSDTLATARSFGFRADAVDRRIEAIQLDDWQERNRSRALKRGIAAFGMRAGFEIGDLQAAVESTDPDFLLVDINCWGARSAAEAGSVPWASFSPYVPPLRAPGLPPFGLGLAPMSGRAGRLRDAAVHAVITRSLDNAILPAINRIRDGLRLPASASVDEFLRRAPLLLVASGRPLQYPGTRWGDAVQMIGPCALDPVVESAVDSAVESADWLDCIDRRIVLVTTSSEQQADAALVTTAIEALSDSDVYVVATLPAGRADSVPYAAHATVRPVVPHGAVLRRSVCAITHGGMGATQKALALGVPVCVVPHGRDQFEVARRVEVAGCGTRLPARRLSPRRLREKTHEAMGMTAGAHRVAEGFAAGGGVSYGADLVEAALKTRNR